MLSGKDLQNALYCPFKYIPQKTIPATPAGAGWPGYVIFKSYPVLGSVDQGVLIAAHVFNDGPQSNGRAPMAGPPQGWSVVGTWESAPYSRKSATWSTPRRSDRWAGST